MRHILHVVGARPNFPKIAPIMRAIERGWPEVRQTLLHTGQHYDERLSDVFFRDLDLPQPDIFLGVGSGSHAEQTAHIMLRFEQALAQAQPDWVVVVGDVNSTVACALVCAKRGVRVAHVEAGLRSWDRSMPEEINRVVTDQLADLLLTPSPDADANLRREGIAPERIRHVGNVMIDSLHHALPLAERRATLDELTVEPQGYGLVTLHRPANVDDRSALAGLLDALHTIGRDLPLLFPIHPRTRQRLDDFGVPIDPAALRLIQPQGYLDFLMLMRHARLVLTDSGGLQEETSVLGVPCLTLRPNTERPITVERGTNKIIGTDPRAIITAARQTLQSPMPTPAAIPLWDGHAADRIAAALLDDRSQ